MSEMPRINWPHRGDKALAPLRRPIDRDVLAAFIHPSPGAYRVGFKWAADKVIEAAKSEGSNADVLFFPVAFLYRHYLELELKDLVQEGVRWGTISVQDKRLTQHNLRKLWEKARELIESVWPTGNRDDTDAVEEVVLEFNALDEKGEAFRYAFDKDGKRHLTDAPEWVGLEKLKETVDAVANYLEGVSAALDAGVP